MSALRYSLVLLTGMLGAASLNGAALAATAASSGAAGWHNPAPGEQEPAFMPHPGGPMFMPHRPGVCQGREVFCASVQSDNPGETLQKLDSILPAAVSGEHYQVVVSVVKIPDHPEKKAGDAPGAPAQQ